MSDHYTIDVTTNVTTTYEVPKDQVVDAEDALERYPEVGIPVHSEASPATAVVTGE